MVLQQNKKWIDLNGLSWRGTRIDWAKSVGLKIKFIYDEYIGELEILEYVNKYTYKVAIHTRTKYIQANMTTESIKECNLGRFFVKSVAETYPELVKYFSNKSDAYKYSIGSKESVFFTCPFCGTKKKQRVSNFVYRGFSCPACSDGISYPNKFMFNVLTQLRVDFKNEISSATRGFEWITDNYRYDFYFEKNGHRYFIEMDGGFHQYQEVLRIDNIKNHLANTNGVAVIRIDCNYLDLRKRFAFIKDNVLNSKLSAIFDLNKIDWQKIEEKSIQNNVIVATAMWRDEYKSVGEIARQLGMSTDAIRKYLTIASDLNMCQYTPVASHQRSNTGEQRSKKVALYKNGLLLYVFCSAKELSRQSIKLYGIYLNHSSICKACRNDMGIFKGFAFQYISDEKYSKLKLELQNKYNNLQEVV